MREIKHRRKDDSTINVTYASREFTRDIPKHEIPDDGVPAQIAYEIIKDELNLDGNPAMNLATFVTTWMEPEADQLIIDTLNKNFIDHDEYPQTEEIHQRVLSMLGRLLNAPEDCTPVGTTTIGSSEAIMLGLLAHKWKWRKRCEAQGKNPAKPNIVFGADAHTCWEKFALYFDVEQRIVPMEPDNYVLTADKVSAHIDENTIAVGAIVGTTFTGQIDEVEKINRLLLKIKKEKGWDIPIHIDGASGGFVAPFIYPKIPLDFRLEQVRSVNVSNHKFGLVYPGLGTVMFRDKSDIPDELIFKINYLGGTMPNYSLNFSHGSSMLLLQYYNLLRLGKSGYRRIMENIMDNAHYLEKRLLDTGYFELLNESKYLPVVVVRLKDPDLSPSILYYISDILRERGWIVPAYSLPKNADNIHVLRMVVKENFSRDMAEKFADDVQYSFKKLDTERIDMSRIGKLEKRMGRIC